MDFNHFHAKEIKGVVRYSPQTSHWRTENRKEHIVGIKLSGKAIHTFASQTFTLTEGCFYFLNQKDDYTVEVTEQPSLAFSIHFTTHESIETDSFCLPVPNKNTFVSILQKAEIAKISGNEHMQFAMLYSLCAELEKVREKAYFRREERIIDAKNYIDEHFRETACIENAALLCGISERRFRTLYQNAYGVTPGRYILSLKTELAKSLLSLKTMSITEIAEQCGFSDVYYFSKFFKSETGISPSKW